MKLLIALMLSIGVVGCASAGGYGHNHGYNGYNSNSYNWVAPLVVGGAIGYLISNQNRQYTPSPVYLSPPPSAVYYTPARRPVYEEYPQYVPSCQCYVTTYIQVGWQ